MREVLVDAVLLSEEMDVADQFLLADNVFRGAAVGSVADQDELRGHFLANERKDLNHIREPLDGTEIRQVHQDRFAPRGPLGAQAGIVLPQIEIAIHEIGDHFDRVLDVEIFERALFQIMGNRRHAVGLLD